MNKAELADIIKNQHIALKNSIKEYEKSGRQFDTILLEQMRSVQWRLEILEREVKNFIPTE